MTSSRMSNSVLVFIDGAYLSRISKYFGKGKYLKINLIRFSQHLAERQKKECAYVYYYNAPPFQHSPPNERDIQLKEGYDSFLEKLKGNPLITIREGRLQKIDNIFTQKGVDTLITMDLCQEPLMNGIKSIILLTSDTDFVPVLNQLRARSGVEVTLCYFSDRVRRSPFAMSNHLLTACDQSVLLSREDFDG